MSTTRLLVLGAVRIFQPAHGYLVRRELASWQVDQWANLNPGSIYNALKSLTRDGMLVEAEADIAVGGTTATAKVTYKLTADGETEFLRLVREALWELHPYDPSWVLAGMSFWWVLSREEVLAALAARRAQIEARLSSIRYAVDDVRREPLKPDHVQELFLIHEHQLQAERAWVDDATARIANGAYVFAAKDRSSRRGATSRRRRPPRGWWRRPCWSCSGSWWAPGPSAASPSDGPGPGSMVG